MMKPLLGADCRASCCAKTRVQAVSQRLRARKQVCIWIFHLFISAVNRIFISVNIIFSKAEVAGAAVTKNRIGERCKGMEGRDEEPLFPGPIE